MQETGERVPRMRTITGIVNEIKAIDPGSCVSRNYVSKLAKSGTVAVVWAGKKALVNLDDVLEVLRVGASQQEPETDAAGGIRRLNAKCPI